MVIGNWANETCDGGGKNNFSISLNKKGGVVVGSYR